MKVRILQEDMLQNSNLLVEIDGASGRCVCECVFAWARAGMRARAPACARTRARFLACIRVCVCVCACVLRKLGNKHKVAVAGPWAAQPPLHTLGSSMNPSYHILSVVAKKRWQGDHGQDAHAHAPPNPDRMLLCCLLLMELGVRVLRALVVHSFFWSGDPMSLNFRNLPLHVRPLLQARWIGYLEL